MPNISRSACNIVGMLKDYWMNEYGQEEFHVNDKTHFRNARIPEALRDCVLSTPPFKGTDFQTSFRHAFLQSKVRSYRYSKAVFLACIPWRSHINNLHAVLPVSSEREIATQDLVWRIWRSSWWTNAEFWSLCFIRFKNGEFKLSYPQAGIVAHPSLGLEW